MTKVIIELDGLEQVLSNLTKIEEQAERKLEQQTKELASATEQAWKSATPERTGRLRAGDTSEVTGLSFTLKNSVHYYPFVDEGHMTPAGWRTRHGYRRAKRRSHVEGRDITPKAIEFIQQNIVEYLSKFLDF